MKNLLKAWPRLARRTAGGHLLLLLDYDGTLTPIRGTPVKAVLSARMNKTLLNLAKTPGITLGIVTGRDLRDVKKLVGLSGLIYAANHGFKITGGGINFTAEVSPAARKALDDFGEELAEKTRGIKGVLIEKKKFSIALHYRLVGGGDLPSLKTVFRKLVKARGQCGLEVRPGKKTIEIMPAANCDKGKAVLHILRRTEKRMRKVTVIYIGDDKTDETAFRALAGTGITVKVGGSRTASAGYFLADTDAVLEFLRNVRVML